MLQISNFLALKDARVGQKLAADSSQMARASKRDSSAMKGLAVLTMVFLPGTFLAVRTFPDEFSTGPIYLPSNFL